MVIIRPGKVILIVLGILEINVPRPYLGAFTPRLKLSLVVKRNLYMSGRPLVLRPACIKTLSAVEARPDRSNQHELNGVVQLKEIFGLEKFGKSAIFSVRGTDISEEAKVTWYDAREDHLTRTEHRLYFQTNSAMTGAQEGDNILIGFDDEGVLHVIRIPRGEEGFREGVRSWEKA